MKPLKMLAGIFKLLTGLAVMLIIWLIFTIAMGSGAYVTFRLLQVGWNAAKHSLG